ISVVALDHARLDIHAVGAGEAVQRRERRAAGVDLEDRAVAVRAAIVGRSVEIPVGALDQARVRVGSVGSREAVEDRELRSAGVQLENCAVPARSAVESRSVEISVAALDDACEWENAIAAREGANDPVFLAGGRRGDESHSKRRNPEARALHGVPPTMPNL